MGVVALLGRPLESKDVKRTGKQQASSLLGTTTVMTGVVAVGGTLGQATVKEREVGTATEKGRWRRWEALLWIAGVQTPSQRRRRRLAWRSRPLW